MEKDPYNVIVAGVGGQGNVLGSQLIGTILVNLKYKVTIGETYGASQRGGSVMSHIRISQNHQYGPLIPPRAADLILGLEPSEGARVLGRYGNPNTIGVINTRSVYSIDVTSGAAFYPEKNQLLGKIKSLCKKVYFLDATEKALELGNPILANIIMIGAVSGAELLPINEDELAKAIRETISADKVDLNLKAFSMGKNMVKAC